MFSLRKRNRLLVFGLSSIVFLRMVRAETVCALVAFPAGPCKGLYELINFPNRGEETEGSERIRPQWFYAHRRSYPELDKRDLEATTTDPLNVVFWADDRFYCEQKNSTWIPIEDSICIDEFPSCPYLTVSASDHPCKSCEGIYEQRRTLWIPDTSPMSPECVVTWDISVGFACWNTLTRVQSSLHSSSLSCFSTREDNKEDDEEIERSELSGDVGGGGDFPSNTPDLQPKVTFISTTVPPSPLNDSKSVMTSLPRPDTSRQENDDGKTNRVWGLSVSLLAAAGGAAIVALAWLSHYCFFFLWRRRRPDSSPQAREGSQVILTSSNSIVTNSPDLGENCGEAGPPTSKSLRVLPDFFGESLESAV